MGNTVKQYLLQNLIPTIKQFYQGLTEEQTLWFWIATAVASAIILGLLFAVLCWICQLIVNLFSRLNKKLRRKRGADHTSGPSPISVKNTLWVGAGILIFLNALSLRDEGVSGWSVLACVSFVIFLFRLVFHIKRSGWLKGFIAFIINGLLGAVTVPVFLAGAYFGFILAVPLIAIALIIVFLLASAITPVWIINKD